MPQDDTQSPQEKLKPATPDLPSQNPLPQEQVQGAVDDANKEANQLAQSGMDAATTAKVVEALGRTKTQVQELNTKIEEKDQKIAAMQQRIDALESDRSASAPASMQEAPQAAPEVLASSDRTFQLPIQGTTTLQYESLGASRYSSQATLAPDNFTSSIPGVLSVKKSADQKQWIVSADPRFVGRMTIGGRAMSFGLRTEKPAQSQPTPQVLKPAKPVPPVAPTAPSQAPATVPEREPTTAAQDLVRLQRLRETMSPPSQSPVAPATVESAPDSGTLLTRLNERSFSFPVGETFSLSYKTQDQVSDEGYDLTPLTMSVDSHLYSLVQEGNQWKCTLKPGVVWGEITIKTKSGKRQMMRLGQGAPAETKIAPTATDTLPPMPNIDFPGLTEQSLPPSDSATESQYLSDDEVNRLSLQHGWIIQAGQKVQKVADGYQVCDGETCALLEIKASTEQAEASPKATDVQIDKERREMRFPVDSAYTISYNPNPLASPTRTLNQSTMNSLYNNLDGNYVTIRGEGNIVIVTVKPNYTGTVTLTAPDGRTESLTTNTGVGSRNVMPSQTVRTVSPELQIQSEIAEVTSDADFNQLVLGSDVPVLVDFYKDDCPPCIRLSSVLESIARKYKGRIRVVRVNGLGKHNLLRLAPKAQEGNVFRNMFPAMHLFSGGKTLDTGRIGSPDQAYIENWMNEHKLLGK
ncbi:MAG: thioredoxin domain-containing protein [Candidatus Peribacteraceae bacterium]